MTEINKTLFGSIFQRKDFLKAIDLKNEKRAKKLWKALRKNKINKRGSKFVFTVNKKEIKKVA